MEIFVLDDAFESLYNLDVFESLIWTERYNGYGNFEFYTSVNDEILPIIWTVQKKMEAKLDCYVWLKESQSIMIIETIEITTDVETGNHLIMSGRGPESILERRIVWKQTLLNGNLQTSVQKLLNDAIISPEIEDRKIPNFVFSSSTDSEISALKIRAQYTGDNLYDVLVSICDVYQLGFDVVLDDSNNFVFSLTRGEDRSYEQDENPYVIFSPKFENIVNSDYLESITTLKNVTLVAGEDKGEERRTRTIGSANGLARRELYTDARDIQSEVDGETIPTEEYDALLDQRGAEKLAENVYMKAFTGEIEALKTFVYGVDFFKGDIVQIVNDFGMETRVRVSEVVRAQDTSGYSVYPTFKVVE